MSGGLHLQLWRDRLELAGPSLLFLNRSNATLAALPVFAKVLTGRMHKDPLATNPSFQQPVTNGFSVRIATEKPRQLQWVRVRISRPGEIERTARIESGSSDGSDGLLRVVRAPAVRRYARDLQKVARCGILKLRACT